MRPLVKDGGDHETTTAEELMISTVRSNGMLGTEGYTSCIPYMKLIEKLLSLHTTFQRFHNHRVRVWAISKRSTCCHNNLIVSVYLQTCKHQSLRHIIFEDLSYIPVTLKLIVSEVVLYVRSCNGLITELTSIL